MRDFQGLGRGQVFILVGWSEVGLIEKVFCFSG